MRNILVRCVPRGRDKRPYRYGNLQYAGMRIQGNNRHPGHTWGTAKRKANCRLLYNQIQKVTMEGNIEIFDTKRYSTNEVCAILGVCRSTLWKYTKEDKIKCGFRRENGRRFFIGREVKRFMNAQM